MKVDTYLPHTMAGKTEQAFNKRKAFSCKDIWLLRLAHWVSEAATGHCAS